MLIKAIIGLVIVFVIWLLIPDKKSDLLEAICVSIYEVLKEKTPEITLEEAQLIIYDIVEFKVLKKESLETLGHVHEDVQRYLSSHGITLNEGDLKKIIRNNCLKL